MLRLTIILLSIILLAASCKEQNTATSEDNQIKEINSKVGDYPTLPTWAKGASIYEVNVRQFSETGDFKGLEDQVSRLADMGIDILWLMPINPISVEKRKAKGDLLVSDIADEEERKKYKGSPYAVADYEKVNPDYGSMDDFKSLLDATHEAGMRLIIDWVPNHTGWDNWWIEKHPEWYTKDKDGNIIDPIDYNTGESWGWTDVADLNYDNQDMRKAMISSMRFWVDSVGLDGFRVDVAHGIPQDFWNQVGTAFTGTGVFMLAESEVNSHLNSGVYHANYAWELHHIMNDVAKGEKTTDHIWEWHKKSQDSLQKGFQMLFTSNHDENTWAGTEFDRMGDAHRPLAVMACTFDGVPLVYTGQEEPIKKRLAFFTQDYAGFKNYAYADFYKTLLDFKEENIALHNGKYGGDPIRISDSKSVLAFKREKNGNVVHGLINMTGEEQEITISEKISGKDLLTGTEVSFIEGKATIAPYASILTSNK